MRRRWLVAPVIVVLVAFVALAPFPFGAANAASPDAWARLDPPGVAPVPRSVPTAVLDADGQRVLVFGGLNAGGAPLADLWALSLEGAPSWSPVRTSGGPGPRWRHSAVFDPTAQRMIVFGGTDSTSGLDGLLDDTWSLSTDGIPTWTKLPPASDGPKRRAGQAAVWDSASQRMIVLGGFTTDTGPAGEPRFLDDVWALSFNPDPTWTKLEPAGPTPQARSGHTAVYDPDGGRVVVFGGITADGLVTDVWSLSLAGEPAWSALSTRGPAPTNRWGYAAAYDPAGHRMLVFGGLVDVNLPSNDLWELGLKGVPAWTKLTPAGSTPIPRAAHASVFDTAQQRLVVYGGETARGKKLSDVWIFAD